MPIGPGKYDQECSYVRAATQAEGVIVIVIDGTKGAGFSCQATPEILDELPKLLRTIAQEIEAA